MNKNETNKVENLRGRTFFFSSDEKHLKESTIKEAVLHKSIYRFAYIKHDRDKYNENDIANLKDKGIDTSKIKLGQKKPIHYHIVLDCKFTPLPLKMIATWFNLPINMINIAKGNKGQNPFIDCCRYLTHEELKQRKLGKQVYSYDEVVASSNFDFTKEMKKINQIRDDFGEDLDKTDAYYRYVSQGLKTLDDIYNMDEDFYNAHLTTLEKLRNDYMLKRATLPKVRINYYIQGGTGMGKSQLAKALARSLCPSIKDRYSFFKALKGKFPFEKYEGQPVIIWDDFRPYDLKQACKGKTGFFNIFDIPDNQGVDIKNNSTRLLNKYNIITGVMPYKEFLDKIAGAFSSDDFEEEDETKQKGQAYRRIPIIINIHEEDFDILLNSGWLDNNGNFEEYTTYQSVRGSMRRIAELCGGNDNLKKQLQNKTVKPILIVSDDIEKKRTKKNHSKKELKEIEEITKDYGKATTKNTKTEHDLKKGQVADDDDLPF